MKKMLSLALCAIMMAVCSTAVQAQTEKSKKQRISREELAEKQARHIAHELALDDATTQKYVDTYKACQQEVWALGPRVKRHQDNVTEAEAEQANKARFEQSEKILKIREKYYKEYSKFLTQKQIERAYELERKSMNRLAKRHHQKGVGMNKNHRRFHKAK